MKTSEFLEMILADNEEYIGSNRTMAAAVALSFMSSVIGARVYANIGANKTNLAVWSLIVAPSTIGRKSSTIKFMRKMILGGVEKQLNRKVHMPIETTSLQLTSRNEARNIVLNTLATHQAVIKYLESAPHGVILSIDEASGFLYQLNKNHESKAAITSLYDDESYFKVLVGQKGAGEKTYIDNPFLSIVAATNHEWLTDSTTKTDIISGFLNRFIIIYAYDKLPEPIQLNTREYPEAQSEKLQSVGLRVLEHIGVNYDAFQVFVPKQYKISKDALDLYENWHNEHAFIMHNIQAFTLDDEQSATIASVTRQITSAVKYAIICKIFDDALNGKDTDFVLSKQYMQIGIDLAELFINKIKEVISKGVIGKYCESQYKFKSTLENKVTMYLKNKKEPKTRSDIQNCIRGLTASNFDKIISNCEYVEKIDGNPIKYRFKEENYAWGDEYNFIDSKPY